MIILSGQAVVMAWLGEVPMVEKTGNGLSVKGFENREFRDIEAFDANIAIIMAVDTPAYILKTIDGGVNWKIVFENKTPGMFLDAMDFANSRMGIVIGDPINEKIFVARTFDSGNTWEESDETLPIANKGEAFFAASGSNVRLFSNNKFFMVSGGTTSRLITPNNTIDLPILQGKESTGANSLDFYDNGIPDKPGRRMIIVGGDFTNDSLTEKNCLYSTNGGKTWNEPRTPPHGYRSCVEFLSQKDILTCGLNGVDYSADGGKNWKWISKEGFHVCRIARMGTSIFLAGKNGKIGKVVW